MSERDESEPLAIGETMSFAPGGPDGPAAIAKELVATCEEFGELREGEARIVFLMRAEPKLTGRRTILGTMGRPAFGEVGNWLLARACNGLPDYVMILDDTHWRAADTFRRTALVHHELKHGGYKRDKEGEPLFTPAGDPVWTIIGHDLEEFDDTVRRFGAWKGDISSFMRALRSSNQGPV